MQRGSTQRGSVLLMVIGLLTVIAMLGSMLLLVSRLDRQTSQALADVAPEYHVASGVLDHLLADRQADLYIDNNGVLYGALDGTADPNAAERGMIDYPADDPSSDHALACVEPTGGIWLHISNLSGVAGTLYSNVPTSDPSLVDTDGDRIPDARLFPTGVMDRDGGTFFAAVRMIDASGLLNVNVAEPNTPLADPYSVMDPSYLALRPLLSSAAPDVASARDDHGDYDMGDMLAAVWQGNIAQDPSTVTGRLVTAARGPSDFLSARGSLTVASTSTATSPLWTYLAARGSAPPLTDPSALKVDPNALDPLRTYEAFLALLETQKDLDPNYPDPNKAAQLAVNLLDYLDANDEPNRIDAGQIDPSNFPTDSWFYGVERHPFVSKVFIQRVWVDPSVDPSADPSGRKISALELINPYVQPIDLDNYFLKVGSNIVTGSEMTDRAIAANGGRFVIRSDVAVQIDPSAFDPGNPSDPNHMELPGLDTTQVISIMWKHPSGWEVCIDATELVDCSAPNATDPSYWNAKFRDDRLENARYTLAIYAGPDPNAPANRDPSANYTRTDAAGPRMGLLNPYSPAPPADPNLCAPVYVRNGGLITLGDLMRLMLLGPTDSEPLTVRRKGLLPTAWWLVPRAASVPINAEPHVPAGCLIPEFFSLVRPIPGSNGTVAGLVNVNTARRDVLRCLPGLADLSDAHFQAVANEIIAYRDRTQIGASGDYRTGRPGPTGISNLRNEPGFACAGEVAIPIQRVTAGLPIGLGRVPPQKITVADPPAYTDDGLPTDDAQPMANDFVKQFGLYSWCANQVAVRSNTFIAYIWVQRVQRGQTPTPTTTPRRYIAVIDRSRCRTAGNRPQVLLFTELR